MSRPIRPPYVPAARGGLADPRSTGAPAHAVAKPLLNDRRSTR
jgi:hypothetical protein